MDHYENYNSILTETCSGSSMNIKNKKRIFNLNFHPDKLGVLHSNIKFNLIIQNVKKGLKLQNLKLINTRICLEGLS